MSPHHRCLTESAAKIHTETNHINTNSFANDNSSFKVLNLRRSIKAEVLYQLKTKSVDLSSLLTAFVVQAMVAVVKRQCCSTEEEAACERASKQASGHKLMASCRKDTLLLLP